MFFLLIAVNLFTKTTDTNFEIHKKKFSSFRNAITGKNKIDMVGEPNGIGRDRKTGKLNKKSSYSPQQTFNRLFK